MTPLGTISASFVQRATAIAAAASIGPGQNYTREEIIAIAEILDLLRDKRVIGMPTLQWSTLAKHYFSL